MKFRTEINILPSKRQISFKHQSLFMGSCFANEIGNRLKDNKLESIVNPFGTLFNPLSVMDILQQSLTATPFPAHFFVQNPQQHWVNLACHSDLRALQYEALLAMIDEQFLAINQFFSNRSNFLFLSFGTSYVYVLKTSGESVANCHKLNADLFDKRLLSVDEITKKFDELYVFLPKNMPIILTVSPVRHLKDTLPLNSVSKSVLRLACHQIVEKYENVDYFPAFELLTDDLRDYRFYANDMLHPSEQAVSYIFEKFKTTFIDDKSRQFMDKWQKISQSLGHQPLQANSAAHQQFLANLLKELSQIKEVDVKKEIDLVNKRLQSLQ